jgi:hypothetical protein
MESNERNEMTTASEFTIFDAAQRAWPSAESVKVEQVDGEEVVTVRFSDGASETVPANALMQDRTILVHLNVTVPWNDERNPDEIADAILAAIEVGSDDDSVRSLGVGGLASGNGASITLPLAEEV